MADFWPNPLNEFWLHSLPQTADLSAGRFPEVKTLEFKIILLESFQFVDECFRSSKFNSLKGSPLIWQSLLVGNSYWLPFLAFGQSYRSRWRLVIGPSRFACLKSDLVLDVWRSNGVIHIANLNNSI